MMAQTRADALPDRLQPLVGGVHPALCHDVHNHREGSCSKARPSAALRNHGKEIVDLVLGAEDCAFERGAVAFGAAQLQFPDLGHVAVAGADLRRLDQGTMAASRAGDAKRKTGKEETVEVLHAHV